MTQGTVMLMQSLLEPMCRFLEPDYLVLKDWENPSLESLQTVRAIIVAGEVPLSKERIAQLPALGLIACFTVGYDGVDVDWARSRGLLLSYAPGVNVGDVADQALGLMIASRRRLLEGDRLVRSGGWQKATKLVTQSLSGQQVGIVGLGGIGTAVAHRCEACGMQVAWWGPHAKPDATWPRTESLLALAVESEILVITSLANESNRGMITAEILHALGPDGLLVNVSRGQLVDEPALVAALKSGRLGSAALDVFQHEPTDAKQWEAVPNVIFTPHSAGATRESVAAMQKLLKANLDAYFAGKLLLTPIP